MKTGWYFGTYYVVKPLQNGKRQQLIMYAKEFGYGRYYLVMGIYSSNTTYSSLCRDSAHIWDKPTSTNKNPSTLSIKLALEALQEIEESILELSEGKRRYLYVDGFDYRRLHAYTRILTKEKYGYKQSKRVKSDYCDLPRLVKTLKK